MHKLIGIIVYSHDKDEAVELADQVASDMCDGSRIYDWYKMFTADSREGTAGIARWGELPSAMSIDSNDGKKFIKEQFEETENQIRNAIKKLKTKLVDMDDKLIDKIIEDGADIDLYSGAFDISNEDSVAYLYDNSGEPITTTKMLNRVLTKWSDPEYDIFVVPVDIHY